MKELDIHEVAQRAGVRASTLRFYEEKGLIQSVGRRGLRRSFEASVLDRLALIALARTADFSLDEIALMFAPDGRIRIDRRVFAEKAKQLDATIRKLKSVSKSLRHAAACQAPSYAECPHFRRMLREATAMMVSAPKAKRQPPASRKGAR